MPIVGITPPTVWSDLDHRIIQDGQGAVKAVFNIDAVSTSINNILGTMQGERVMLPNFASRLSQMIFEPLTDELSDWISREVKLVVERWDDRVEVMETQYSTDADNNIINIEVLFRVKGYDKVFSTKVAFNATQ
jgi:phage baseplate assembly protein W